jgi:ATP-dependent RNA helicase DeaD
VFQIRNIERYTNTRIHRGKPPTVGEVEEARANVFLDKIRATLKSGDFKRQDQLIERLLEEGFSTTDIASALLHQLQSADSTAATASRAEAFERPDRFDERAGGPREERSGARRRSADFRPQHRGDRFRSADRRQERPRGDGRAARHAEASTALPTRDTSVRVQPDVPPRIVPASLKAHGDKILHPTESFPPRGFAKSERPAKKKHNPNPPPNQTRLFMNIGAAMNITPIDIVNSISGETGLPGNIVGTVDIRERHSFVDVATEHAKAVIAKLNRSQVKGHKTKVKVA